MECAITLAKRGASVELVERGPMAGGSLGLITRLPGLGEWGRIGAYRAVQMKRLPNIELITGAELDAHAIRSWDADVVVLATGSAWAADGLNAFTRAPIPGADASLPHVLTPEQVVLEGKRPPGGPVIVYDGEGYYTAPAIAELLAGEGLQVELVTGHDQVAPFCAETLEDVLTRRRVHDAGVSMRTGTVITAVEPGRILAENAFGAPLEIAAAGIVLVTQRVSRDELFHELEGTVARLHRVGDCVAPRLLAEAIFDGHRLAREIESADPDVALPYLRERPLQEAPDAPAPERPGVPLDPRTEPRPRRVRLLGGGPDQIASGIRELVSGRPVVVAAGRGAGPELGPYRRLAEAWGATFAVSRPQVEAARATRAELVGASSLTVAPGVYVAFGISGAIPHLVGMSDSDVVVAVNTDRSARIFEHADVGAVADAGDVVAALLEMT
jgi:electron transfer flavoprotein alpha subunit